MAKKVQHLYYVVEFQNGKSKFIAFGLYKDDFWPVYELIGSSYKGEFKGAPYPACMKFMPYAEAKPIKRLTMEQIRKSYPLESMAKFDQLLFHMVEFQNAERAFIAFSREENGIWLVYELIDSTYQLVRGLHYPACVDYSTRVTDVKPMRHLSMKQIRETYPLE